ncbi:peptidoglycan D,D-transpeptidase FtsI family protein [Streptomyces sulphureus]|uniref:peptidoglycan D,D-transpeptidase FtsI family protein n=1 Tax=Streptomyces sulphureus TaxID=47758 RepID=UPI00036B210A|nr:penicillin-binding protein 2 [Streptomyces sulphureus]
MSQRPDPRRKVPGPARPQRARGEPPRAARKPPARQRPSGGGRGGSGLRLASYRPRLRLVGVGLTLIVAVFSVRLLQVQAVDASAFAEKAALNRYVKVPLAAERGAITARDGTPFASTVDAYDITADPYLFTRKQTGVADAPERAAALLAPVIDGNRQKIAEQLSRTDTRYVLLARQRTPQEWRKIKELKSEQAAKASEKKGANVLAGVFQQEHAKRIYPNKDLASGVLGFVNSEGEGGAGLEAKLDKKLAGEDGRITYAQSGGRQVPTAGVNEESATPGSDMELTLDRDIQFAAQRALADRVESSDADSGYVVVQDTRSGQLLAMANAPGFDPNDLSGASAESLGNPTVQDVYEPGSTSKLMSMAAVLEEGKATPSTQVTVPNRLKRADRFFADDVDHPTWQLTLNGVLAKSSNIGTILATEQLGGTQAKANRVLHDYLRRFGIGRPTGLGLPGETEGILPKPGKWSSSQQYTIPFGQGLSLNAVQAASIYSTIANGGVRKEPTLVRGTTQEDGRYVRAPEPKERRVVSEKTARTLSRMLESVVDDMEGTGTTAKIPGYRVAGKTGTANRVDPKTGRYDGYTASFAGFAPADKPRVTVYCAVQNPKKGSYFGSDVCGPVYKKVMNFALKSLQIPPTGDKPAQMPVFANPGSGSTD